MNVANKINSLQTSQTHSVFAFYSTNTEANTACFTALDFRQNICLCLSSYKLDLFFFLIYNCVLEVL